MMRVKHLIAAVVGCGLLGVATAGKRAEEAAGFGDELPDLQVKLEASGWTMTPERSASYAVGDIYSSDSNTPVAFGTDCFEAKPRESVYTSLEVIQALQGNFS